MKISHASTHTDTASQHSAVTAKKGSGVPALEAGITGERLPHNQFNTDKNSDQVSFSKEALERAAHSGENNEKPPALTYNGNATFHITRKNAPVVRPSIEVLEEVRSILDESLAKTESAVTSMTAGIGQYLKNQGENL